MCSRTASLKVEATVMMIFCRRGIGLLLSQVRMRLTADNSKFSFIGFSRGFVTSASLRVLMRTTLTRSFL